MMNIHKKPSYATTSLSIYSRVYKPMSWIKMMMMMMINCVILKSQTGCIMGTGLKCLNFCTGLHRWEADRSCAMGGMQSFLVSISLLTTADAVLPLEWMKHGFRAALNNLSDCYCSHENMWNVLSGSATYILKWNWKYHLWPYKDYTASIHFVIKYSNVFNIKNISIKIIILIR